MLIVLYGSTAEVGFKSREFWVESGFELIEKLNCSDDCVIPKERYQKRNWITEEEFYKRTDSLFRYEIGGVHVGFNQEQILDAVSNNANKLLTLSSPDISFLREIKEVYGDSVKTIYCYIDKNTLEQIVERQSGINRKEKNFRLEMGRKVRDQYSRNSDLFDHVVIYNGEQSEFNLRNLIKQYKAINNTLNNESQEFASYDIFFSYARKDIESVRVIRDTLVKEGYNVFFDQQDIPCGVDYADFINKTISSSKVIVAIITQNAVKSKYVSEEIKEALRIAENSAVIVIPVFIDSDINTKESDELLQLSLMQGVICNDGNAQEAGERLSNILEKLFSGLDDLELYSEQVNNYVFIKEYDKALELQKKHRNLCIELSEISDGKYVGIDATINSEIKLISILIDMNNWNDALDEVVDTLKFLDDDCDQKAYFILIEQFALCCVRLNLTEDEVASIIRDRINIYSIGIEYLGELLDHFNYDLCEELMNEYLFRNGKEKTETNHINKDNIYDEEAVKIAQHGEAAMRIFDGLIDTDLTVQTRSNMIEGYQRVLNYCMQLGLSEQISSECIKKIAELKETEAVETLNNSAIEGALRVFLGQAAPGSGNYDVFISFKSEDEPLARKVFEFLRQNGKEVFFSKETLTILGESEYEDAIYEALDHSKHLVLVATNPEYFKTDWVSREWKYFNNKNRASDKKGKIVIVLPREYITAKEKLPPQLRYDLEIIEISKFKDRLLSYVR